MPDLFAIAEIALYLILAVWLISCVFIVRGKTAAILETFGKPARGARFPGLHFKLPWPITLVVGRINLQLQEIKANVSVKTKDNAFMELPVTVQYRASPEKQGAVAAFYELENPEIQITSYVLNNVRQTASSMDMADLYANRDGIETSVAQSLSESFNRFGYNIENVLVDEPQPSAEVRQAFNRVIASIREKEAAENIAEARRIELVGVAKAEKESKRLQGEGVADMRRAIALGLKEAMQEMRGSGLSAEQALSLLMDTNRLDTLDTAAVHGNMVIVDMQGGATALASTVAAVKVAGQLGADDPPAPAPLPRRTPLPDSKGEI
ncbi:MAG: SPFH domain-containing protein [Rhodovibrionaceae bacterium]